MKLVITIIVTLGAVAVFSQFALQDPGYVVLARGAVTIRLPLALFVLLVLIVFAGLYLLFNFIAGVLRAPARLRKWRRRRNRERAQLYTMRGYAGLIEGDWSKAEKKLLTHLQHNISPLLNYLGAAYAAQQRGDLARRDQYLADALTEHPQQRLAVGLTRARLHHQAGEIAACRDVLEKLRKIAPGNVPAARLLADAYRALGDWNSLTALLPTLVRLKAYPPEALAEWEKLVCEHFLSSPALLQGGRMRRVEAFESLPAASKKTPAVIASYSRQLLMAGSHVLAEKTLRKALNRGWDAELAYLYGQAETPFTGDQIMLAESWGKKYGEHADLTLTLARLYRRDRQLKKARELFSRALSAGGREEACADLGSLLEEMGEKDAALRCYRRGIVALAPALATDAPPPVTAGELVAPDAKEAGAVEPEVMPVVR